LVSLVQFHVAALGFHCWLSRRASTCVPIAQLLDSLNDSTAPVTVDVGGMTTDVSKRSTPRCDAVLTVTSAAAL
jgi:hypothetical protein